MWLRILDYIGLTNLTDEEINQYYKRAKEKEIASSEINKERIEKHPVHRFVLLDKVFALRYSRKFIQYALLLIAIVSIPCVMVVSNLGDPKQIKLVIHNDNGDPQIDVSVVGPDGESLTPDRNGTVYVYSSWLGQNVKILDLKGSLVTTWKIHGKDDKIVINVVTPPLDKDSDVRYRDIQQF